MTQTIDTIVSQLESGQLSRRQAVASLTTLVAGLGRDTLSASQRPGRAPASRSLLTEADRKPFEEIAKRKGMPIRRGTFDAQSKIATNEIHLDMDMVDESIRTAIKQAQRNGQQAAHGKLERLLQGGTDAQKVEFVLGSGTYYFPEDLDEIARRSRAAGGKALDVDCHKVCETIWYYICRCTSSAQECRDEAREFCHIVCG